jgi:hypothetical protein
VHPHGSARLSVHSRHAIVGGYSRDGASARLPGRLRCPGRRPPSGWPDAGRGVRQGCKTARRDPTESPVWYPSASYARSSCCVGSAWGATGSPERCLSRARRSTGFFAGLACSGSRVLNPDPIRTATSGLTPVICCTWTPRSWAARAPLVRYSSGRSEDLSGAGRDGTSKDLCAGRGPSGPDRAIPATASHPARCNAAGQKLFQQRRRREHCKNQGAPGQGVQVSARKWGESRHVR